MTVAFTLGKRIEQLTFTRFLAAIAIVVFHDGLDVFPFNIPALQNLFARANVGVSYFFLLSGFVMIIAYWRKGGKSIQAIPYYVNRLARIYPAYGIALLLVTLVFLVSGDSIGTVAFFSSALLLQAWIPGFAATLNVPGWSLSVEAFFYLVFPFFFNVLYARRQFAPILISVVLFWCISQVVSQIGPGWFPGSEVVHDIFYYHPLIHLNEFMIGNVFGLLFMQKQEPRNFRRYDVAILILVCVLLLTVANNAALNFHNGMLAIFFVPLILLLSFNTGVVTKLFTVPLLVLLGEISYGVYIYQKPVKYYLNKIFLIAGVEHRELRFYVFLVTLVLFSYGSYRYVEQPLRNIIQRRARLRMTHEPSNP